MCVWRNWQPRGLEGSVVLDRVGSSPTMHTKEVMVTSLGSRTCEKRPTLARVTAAGVAGSKEPEVGVPKRPAAQANHLLAASARVAKSVDARASGVRVWKNVRVRVPPCARGEQLWQSTQDSHDQRERAWEDAGSLVHRRQHRLTQHLAALAQRQRRRI